MRSACPTSGFQILYHHSQPATRKSPASASSPPGRTWRKILRDRGVPLTSLESALPLKDFDVIGFSLQYELNYTGVLNILHLAGIPFRAAERGENFPLIIGGGPCALNPEPLADFFDAFVLGDGEEVILEICREIIASQEKSGIQERRSCERLSRIEGVYIPSLFRSRLSNRWNDRTDSPVKRRLPLRRSGGFFADLNLGAFPARPILPFHGSDSRPPEHRNRPGLHPGLPFLPGRNDLPPPAGKVPEKRFLKSLKKV